MSTNPAPRTEILFPPMRLVQGDLYKANDTDYVTKQKKIYPAGHAKAGQPKIDYFFAGAIEKKPGEQAWWVTPWGAICVAVATAAFPNGQTQIPSFAWKIEDGDSMIPNKAGRKNGESEGMPGHWIVNFSTVIPLKVYQEQNGRWAEWPQVDAVKLGDFVEVKGSVSGNGQAGNPGIYVNPDMIAFRGYGKRIVRAYADPNTAGFGQSALPAGASAAPLGGVPMPAGPGMPAGFPAPGQTPPFAGPGMPAGAPTVGMQAPGVGLPYAPGQPVPGAGPPSAPAGTTIYPSNPQVAVQPSAGFIAPPGAPQAPAPVAPAAPPAGPVMTVKANGVPWAAFAAQNWTVEAARAQGYVV